MPIYTMVGEVWQGWGGVDVGENAVEVRGCSGYYGVIIVEAGEAQGFHV